MHTKKRPLIISQKLNLCECEIIYLAIVLEKNCNLVTLDWPFGWKSNLTNPRLLEAFAAFVILPRMNYHIKNLRLIYFCIWNNGAVGIQEKEYKQRLKD